MDSDLISNRTPIRKQQQQPFKQQLSKTSTLDALDALEARLRLSSSFAASSSRSFGCSPVRGGHDMPPMFPGSSNTLAGRDKSITKRPGTSVGLSLNATSHKMLTSSASMPTFSAESRKHMRDAAAVEVATPSLSTHSLSALPSASSAAQSSAALLPAAAPLNLAQRRWHKVRALRSALPLHHALTKCTLDPYAATTPDCTH